MTQTADQAGGGPLRELAPQAHLRVGMSEFAVDILGLVGPIVATYADDLETAGGRITQAAMIAEYGQYLLTLTVAHYKLSGMTWEAIAKHLGVSRQAAQQRYADQVARYQRVLLYLWILGPDAPRDDASATGGPDQTLAPEDALLLHLLRGEEVDLDSIEDIHERDRRQTAIPTGLLDPAGVAAVLDGSMSTPAADHGDADTQPVSGHLPRMAPVHAANLLKAAARHLPRLRETLDPDQFRTWCLAYGRREVHHFETALPWALTDGWPESALAVLRAKLAMAREDLRAVKAGEDPHPDTTTSTT